MKTAVAAFALVATLAFATAANAEMTWTLSGDASSMVPNPNGQWTYGEYMRDEDPSNTIIWSPGGPLSGNANLCYFGNADMLVGMTFYNPTSTAFVAGNQWLAPGQVALFPSETYVPFCDYSPFVRWTAPSEMTVKVDALFTGQDTTNSANVHVLLNGDGNNGRVFTGTHLYDGQLDGNIGNAALGIAQSGTAPSLSYSSGENDILVHAGDHIDFTIDSGSAGWNKDMTGLAVTITQTPEPATMAMLVSGLVGLLAYAWRKRK